MARDFARLLCSVWGDRDWTDRSSDAQRLYMLLISQSDITYAGTVPYRPRRWARLSKDSSITKVRRAYTELEHHGFIVTDEATEETLIRTFICHDKVLKIPNVARAMVKAYQQILSAHLRDVVLHEVARIHRNQADDYPAASWSVVLAPAHDGGMGEDVEAVSDRGGRPNP